MPVRVASVRDRPAIERFNRRLAAGGRPERLPLPDGEARVDDDRPWKTVHIGVDREGEVRAGIQLVHERFFVRGEERWGAWAQMPLSEGVVDRRHGLVAFQVFRALTRQYPLAVGVGLGGPDEIAARFLIKCGCRCAEVPFVYLPLRPRRMVRELRNVRSNRVLWLALRGATWTGAPQLALGTQRWWMRRRRRVPPVQTSVEPGFGRWATDTYEVAREQYGAVACRDAAALDRRYLTSDDRWVRIRIRAADSSSDVGWAVVAPMQMREHRYFGNLRLGVVVDAFSRPGQEGAVLAGASDVLGSYDVDVIVANWSSVRWLSAAAAVGFHSGPSNYYMFATPTAQPLLTDLPVSDMHITRGDSDGMVNLKGSPLQR